MTVINAASPLNIDLEALNRAFDAHAIVDAIRTAFIDYAEGRYVQPAPLHLSFPGGDCHVKAGYKANDESFAVKIATGFYANHERGLPNGHGMLLLSSQRTGLPIAIFEDRGMLTAWRTTAAAVLAVQAAVPARPVKVGIVGAGLQAEQIAGWLPHFCDLRSISIWARRPDRAAVVAAALGTVAVDVEEDLEKLCRSADVIVTTTPAEQPIVRSEWVSNGTHIVALGADNPGKVEIDPALVARCATIMTDDHAQCLDHGDFGHAVRCGLVTHDADVALGLVLAGRASGRRCAGDVTLVDLTGLAAQDDAIARLFVDRLRLRDPQAGATLQDRPTMGSATGSCASKLATGHAQ